MTSFKLFLKIIGWVYISLALAFIGLQVYLLIYYTYNPLKGELFPYSTDLMSYPYVKTILGITIFFVAAFVIQLKSATLFVSTLSVLIVVLGAQLYIEYDPFFKPITTSEEAFSLGIKAAQNQDPQSCFDRIPDYKISLRDACLVTGAIFSHQETFCENVREKQNCLLEIGVSKKFLAQRCADEDPTACLAKCVKTYSLLLFSSVKYCFN